METTVLKNLLKKQLIFLLIPNSKGSGGVTKRVRKNNNSTYQVNLHGQNVGSYDNYHKARRASRLFLLRGIKMMGNDPRDRIIYMKQVKATNIKTGGISMFKNKQIAADNLGMTWRMVNYVLEGKYKQAKGWKFEHI